jgi:hypothetical protein
MISGTGLPPSALQHLPANSQVQNQPNADTQPGANNGTSGAFYTQLDFDHPSVSSLGLRVPSNDGDAEALLAEVSLLLEKAAGQSRNDRDAALAQGLHGAFLSILQSSVALAGFASDANAAVAQKAVDETKLAQDKTQLATDLQTLESAQTAYDAAVASGDKNKIAQAKANLTQAETTVSNLATDKTQVAADLKTLETATTAYNAAVKSGDSNKIAQAKANLQQAEGNLSKDDHAITTDNTNIATDQTNITTNIALYDSALTAFQAAVAPVAASVAASIAQRQPAGFLDDHGHDLIQKNEFDKIFIDILQKFTNVAQGEKTDTALQRQFADQAALGNVGRAALGLLAGLVDVLTALQQLHPGSIASNANNPSLSAGSRVKIPL